MNWLQPFFIVYLLRSAFSSLACAPCFAIYVVQCGKIN
jgi:hypothetical protein